MTSMNFRAVVLAAGMGTRMKSDLPKVLHTVLGRPMVCWPVSLALDAGADRVAVVVGHGREQVEATLDDAFDDARIVTRVQREMLGTADAVRSAIDTYRDYDGAVMIMYGDVPNLGRDEIDALVAAHASGDSPLSLLTAIDDDEHQYGRLVRDAEGRADRIVEFKDADADVRAVREVNIGLYLVDADFLCEGLEQTRTDNAAGEFYLTDLIAMARDRGRHANVVCAEDIDALHGVNHRGQLGAANRLAQARLNEAWMREGVTMRDSAATWIDHDVELARDVLIEPGCFLLGGTRVGAGAVIEAGCRLDGVVVAPGERVPAGTRRHAE